MALSAAALQCVNAAIDARTALLVSDLVDQRHTEPRGDAMFVCSKCQRISTSTGTPAGGYLQGHHVGTCDHCRMPDPDTEQTLELPVVVLHPAALRERHAASA